MVRIRSLISLVCLVVAIPAALRFPLVRWHRLSNDPVLSPQGDGWESAGTFNPAVVLHHGKFVMLYRAQDKSGISRLGYAESTDGIRFSRHSEPVLVPKTDYEKDGGVEDPRLVKFGDTYYLTYTGYNKKDAQLCLATSSDLMRWRRRGVILPAYKGRWNVGLDEIRGNRAAKDQWQILDVFPWHQCRQERSDGVG